MKENLDRLMLKITLFLLMTLFLLLSIGCGSLKVVRYESTQDTEPSSTTNVLVVPQTPNIYYYPWWQRTYVYRPVARQRRYYRLYSPPRRSFSRRYPVSRRGLVLKGRVENSTGSSISTSRGRRTAGHTNRRQ